jgi:hypothetical protein
MVYQCSFIGEHCLNIFPLRFSYYPLIQAVSYEKVYFFKKISPSLLLCVNTVCLNLLAIIKVFNIYIFPVYLYNMLILFPKK